MKKLLVGVAIAVTVLPVTALPAPAATTRPLILLDGVARTYRTAKILNVWRSVRDDALKHYDSVVVPRVIEVGWLRNCALNDAAPDQVLLCSNAEFSLVGAWGGVNNDGGGVAVIPLRRSNLAWYICHEFGHVLGLQHRHDGKSCMTYDGPAQPDAADLTMAVW